MEAPRQAAKLQRCSVALRDLGSSSSAGGASVVDLCEAQQRRERTLAQVAAGVEGAIELSDSDSVGSVPVPFVRCVTCRGCNLTPEEQEHYGQECHPSQVEHMGPGGCMVCDDEGEHEDDSSGDGGSGGGSNSDDAGGEPFNDGGDGEDGDGDDGSGHGSGGEAAGPSGGDGGGASGNGGDVKDDDGGKSRTLQNGHDDAEYDAALRACFGAAPLDKHFRVMSLYSMLDVMQRRALYGILVMGKRVTVISGPAGSGKSALIKIVVLLKAAKVAAVAPTHGARRANQEGVDGVLPRRSFKPELEVLTTYTGFGVSFGEQWDVDKVVQGIIGGDVRKGKAAALYQKEMVLCDEAAQTLYSQIDMAKEVGPRVNGGERQRFVLLMDGLQTPPVIDGDHDPEREMIWEGDLFCEAERDGELACFALETVYRTGNRQLLDLGVALRNEDYECAQPLIQMCVRQTMENADLDVVHDNFEIYDIAASKFAHKPGLQVVSARCEVGGPGEADLLKWPRDLQRAVRDESKMLLEMLVYPGQRLHYQPVGNAGVRTGNIPGRGWFLTKGEPMDVVQYHADTRQLEVTCPALPGNPKAWIPEEFVWVDLGETYGTAKLWGPPYR